MARYIDADAVEKYIADYYDAQLVSYPQGKEKQRLLGGINFGRNVVKDAPTADVVKVNHGEWTECDWVIYDGHSECVHYPKAALCCSKCKHTFKKELLWTKNYCPNCGAKMDGRGDNNA